MGDVVAKTKDKSADQPFTQLHVAGSQYATLSAAVPSRLSCVHGQLRIVVKDLFRLHGLKTSFCNSSYYKLSTPASETATVVQLLVDRGHHILGLTKLSSMISREEPSDAVDFQTAFNPRGDGCKLHPHPPLFLHPIIDPRTQPQLFVQLRY